jgi:hypothetical protein
MDLLNIRLDGMADAKWRWETRCSRTRIFTKITRRQTLVVGFISMTPLIKPVGVKAGLLACFTLLTSSAITIGLSNMDHLSKKLISAITFLVLLFSASSCQYYMSNIMPKRPDREFKVDENASPEFKQGWRDGCETGMAGGSNTFYKMFYRNNAADGYKMTSSSDYKTAWGNAFWFCYRYDYIKHKSSVWSGYFVGLQ